MVIRYHPEHILRIYQTKQTLAPVSGGASASISASTSALTPVLYGEFL